MNYDKVYGLVIEDLIERLSEVGANLSEKVPVEDDVEMIESMLKHIEEMVEDLFWETK